MEHVLAIPLPAAKGLSVSDHEPAVELCRAKNRTMDFIAGPENRLAGGLIEWFLKPDSHGYSPLVLQGPSGVGKSHLAHGIAALRSGAVLTHGAEFARELAEAVENRTVAAWRDRYRSTELFVLEDLTELAGRTLAQQELANTLDVLEARETPVVITSRRSPAEIARLTPALRSRLAGGLVVTVAPPGLDARVVILQRLATGRGLILDLAAIRVLAAALPVTAGELHGALQELELGGGKNSSGPASDSNGIDVDQVRRYLELRRTRMAPRLDDVTRRVAKHYRLRPADLIGPSRRRSVVAARNVAIYLGRQLIGSSLVALAKHFGGRDHTTILHSLRSMERQFADDGELRSAVTALRRKIETGNGDNPSRKRR